MSDALRPSVVTAPWRPGVVIKERYRLESLLRRGGMGSVWRAEHVELKSPVAIKVLEPGVARDPVMVQRFLREAQAAASLRSPNVVQIYDYGIDDGQAFIAMEMLVGEPLSERITRLGRLPPEELVRFLAEVLRAMHKAHEAGIIHRDLKPDNIFICQDEPCFAKVLDFGVAKVKKGVLFDLSSGGTQTGLMLGTPYYMSPEQAQAKELDQRTDLWSVAVIAFEALLGRRPFVAEALGDLVVAICTAPTPVPSRFGPVPPGFDEWFVRGTQRDPARRFQSAREMAEELERLLVPDAFPGLRRASTSRNPSLAPSLPRSNTSSPGHAASPVTSSAPGRVSSPLASHSVPLAPAEVRDLQLTTGQRTAVTRTPHDSSGPRGSNTGLFALLGLGVLILVGVLAFVVGGGARALHRAELGAGKPERRLAAPPPAPSLPVAAEGASSRPSPALSASAAPTSPASR